VGRISQITIQWGKKNKQYYIQNGWIGNSILWWGIKGSGYTTEIDKAGRYSYEETKKIIQRPEGKAWECKHVDECLSAHKTIIDGQYLDRKKCIRGKKS